MDQQQPKASNAVSAVNNQQGQKQQPVPSQPVTPGGAGGKEYGPMTVSTASGVEVSQPIGKEENVAKSIEREENEKMQGTDEEAQKSAQLSQEINQSEAGVDKEAVQAVIQPPSTTPLPMSYTDAKQKQKKSKIRDALKWLATMIIYQWRKAQPELKK